MKRYLVTIDVNCFSVLLRMFGFIIINIFYHTQFIIKIWLGITPKGRLLGHRGEVDLFRFRRFEDMPSPLLFCWPFLYSNFFILLWDAKSSCVILRIMVGGFRGICWGKGTFCLLKDIGIPIWCDIWIEPWNRFYWNLWCLIEKRGWWFCKDIFNLSRFHLIVYLLWGLNPK